MKLIKEITHSDIGLINKSNLAYKLRKASRAILFNDEGKIAVMHVTNEGYHKLPGGGFEDGEDVARALQREVMEEVGATITNIEPFGLTIEYRDEFEQIQISYYYSCHLTGPLQEQSLTESEIKEGFKLKWLEIEDALRQMDNDKPDSYVGKLILLRDYEALKAFFTHHFHKDS